MPLPDTNFDTMRITIGVWFLFAKAPVCKGFPILFNDNRLCGDSETVAVEPVLVCFPKKIPDNTGLMLHSDQGWHYQHKQYRRMLEVKGIKQSMRRKGNCYDNSVMENFFGHLKSELRYLQEFESMEHFFANLVVFDKISYSQQNDISLHFRRRMMYDIIDVLKGASPMARSEKAVFTNMCMVYDDDGNILVQDRLNPDFPGVTFPGGHVEYKESFCESVIREVKEETGLTIESPVLCGVKHFYTLDDKRYVVLFYRTNRFSGELKSSEEGKVFWIKRNELQNYVLAEYFDEMLKVFESETVSEMYFYNDNGLKFELL